MSPQVTRSIIFCLVGLAVFQGWWVVAALLVLYDCVRFDAYELLVLAWCVDIYFSPSPFVFWYTGLVFGVLVVMQWLRPRLRGAQHTLE